MKQFDVDVFSFLIAISILLISILLKKCISNFLSLLDYEFLIFQPIKVVFEFVVNNIHKRSLTH